MPTVKQFLDRAGDLKLDAEVILAHILEKDRAYLAAHPETSVPGPAVALFQKRKSGLPLAYVLGEKEFYGRKFKVTPDVLIPRPETEAVVDLALSRINTTNLDDGQFITVIDVGTGSGTIAVTIDLEAKKPVKAIGLDLSEKALEVAEENNERLDAHVQFFESDLLEIFDQGLPDSGEVILIANLPYVSRAWDWTSPELAFEPALALYAEADGLKIIFDFLDETKEKIDKGWIYLEADPCQHAKIRKKVESLGFRWLKTSDFAIEIEI